MNNSYFIQQATMINEGLSAQGSLFVRNGVIEEIYTQGEQPQIPSDTTIIDARGLLLFPGIIDTHVHFREPGATHKADIAAETKAAVAGGITSFMDMPNNSPAITTLDLLEEKFERAAQTSLANYSFYLGATNENLEEIKKINSKKIGGVKLFLGSSTGNMLVNDEKTLSAIFAESPVLIAAHCEDETIIQRNIADFKSRYGENISAKFHSLIRSEEACVRSTEHTIALAEKYNAQLHVLHLTTAKETTLFGTHAKITAEACIPQLWFCDNDYERLQNFVKCNPAIKTANDRNALRNAVSKGIITTIASDHAPHTRDEKLQSYWNAPSGMPSLQYSLPLMLEIFSPETVVSKMCHAPSLLFNMQRRGFIRKGYFADLVLVNPSEKWTITDDTVLSKCGWAPYAETTLQHKITHTFVNGNLVAENGKINETYKGQRILFN